MPSLGCKIRPISAEPSRYPSTRASISHNVSNFTNDDPSSLNDTGTKFFITSTQQGFYPSVVNQPTTPRLTSTSFNRTFHTTTNPPKRPPTAKKDEDNVGLNLSMALLEVKDEKGNPLVRPMRRLQADKFHTFLYKFKQEKSELEHKINRLQGLEQELKENKLRSTAKGKIEQSLLERSFRRKVTRNSDVHNSTFQETISEEASPFKVFRHSIISSALSTATPATSTRAKSAVGTVRTPKRPNSVLGLSSNRNKASFGDSSHSTTKHEESKVIMEEKFVRYSATQNSVDLSKIVETKVFGELETLHSDVLTETGKYFFTRASKEKEDIDREKAAHQQQLNQSLPVGRPKTHTLMISLSSVPSPNKYMRNRYYQGETEKCATIHSKKSGNQSRMTPERGVRKRNNSSLKNSVDEEMMQEWFDSLTIQGSTVEPRVDMSVYMNSHNPVAAIKRNLWSTKIQRRKDKVVKEEEKSRLENSQMKISENTANKEPRENVNEGKQGTRTVEWTLQRGKVRRKTEGTPRSVKDEQVKESPEKEQSQKEKEKERRRGRGTSLFMEDTVKTRLEGWDVLTTNENLDKGTLGEN